MNCYIHIDKPAVTTCPECGMGLCRDCVNNAVYTIENKPLCHNCSLSMAENELSEARSRKVWSLVKMIFGASFLLLGISIYCSTGDLMNGWIYAGIAGIPAAFKSTRSSRRQKLRNDIDDAFAPGMADLATNWIIRLVVRVALIICFAPIMATFAFFKNLFVFIGSFSAIKKAKEVYDYLVAGEDIDVEGTDTVQTSNVGCLPDVGTSEPYAPQREEDEYLNKARRRTDEELKVILQHEDDYNGRLVSAAKQVLLDRMITPDSQSSSAPVFQPVATEDDKYKAYQPRAGSAESERYKEQTPVRPYNDYDMPKESSKIDEREAQGLAGNTSTERVTAPAVRPSRNNLTVLISILVGVLLAVGGALGYFLWYAPYVKDRDAQRTYVVADNVFLRSSRITGVEYNILGKVPYGTEIITYHKLGEWAEVKVGKQEGVIAAAYLLAPSDFALLNGVWGDNDAKECVESSKCRLAILDYLKNNYLQSGPGAWQLYTRPVNQKPNMVFYPRIYDKYSKYTDFVFIIGDHATGNRVLVCYSFDDATEKPIFRFSAGAPASGFIKNIVPKYGGMRVVFDNNEYLDISL